jgi:Ca-activated chloride channel family protein
VSFAAPLVLIGLLVVPALCAWYLDEQRRRGEAASAFASVPLRQSVAPRRPGWRRHLPIALLGLALAMLIVAAARPRHAVTVPVKGATVMLANDVSNSMKSTDVQPSRLVAAKRAATSFVNGVTSQIQVGSIEFARKPTLLQSPTTDHRQTAAAIAGLKPGGGGTAIGEALELALDAIKSAPRIAGKHAPGAIVLISDGASNVGVSPLLVAQEAKKRHVPIYTVSIGTAHGTIQIERGGHSVTTPVPVDPTELHEIAVESGGQPYRAADSATVHEIYERLAKKLGETHVQRSLTGFAIGIALALIALAGGLSLLWFGRLT